MDGSASQINCWEDADQLAVRLEFAELSLRSLREFVTQSRSALEQFVRGELEPGAQMSCRHWTFKLRTSPQQSLVLKRGSSWDDVADRIRRLDESERLEALKGALPAWLPEPATRALRRLIDIWQAQQSRWSMMIEIKVVPIKTAIKRLDRAELAQLGCKLARLDNVSWEPSPTTGQAAAAKEAA